MNISVIGAGITGLMASYYLAKSGHDVTVYEAESYPAMRCSRANGGQISVSNSEVWTTWSNIVKGLKWMLKKDAPLLLRPSLDWDKAIWLAKFIYCTANNDSARRTAETIRLGLESRKLYAEIIEKEKIDFDQSYRGILHIYKDQKYFKRARQVQDLYESNGCEWQLLTPEQVIAIEPTLEKSHDIVGGAWTPSDWTGDIHKFCVHLEQVLRRKYKVDFFYNHDILHLEYLWGDKFVISGGVGSVELARSIGDNLPIYPVKGYSITIDLHHHGKHAPMTSLLDDQAKIVTSRLGNRLRVAGTAELAGENYDIRHDRIRPLLNWVKENFPQIPRKDYTQWACLRPMTPNMMPIVKQSKRHNNIYYHTGHGHLGWTLAPATAVQLTQLINTGR